ncbi:cation:proton antiporter [Rhodoplanes sp. SY1]|uniref:cation:proton antiporter n=1 Tax=Rhodoplanes sp. SY1 TaxID=3166646 RepID=UPI0038B5EF25
MIVFETILVLLLGAVLLSMLARRIGVPYPTLLALGGGALALVPGAPRLELPSDLILALFVAPILLDAAHDTSLRDMMRLWLPVSSLVIVAVGLTTTAVAITVRWLFPDMPWGAAIALGALLAPPDAVAALAVMRQVTPPHRIRAVLEAESLLNDASSLLIYKLAVVAVVTGSYNVAGALPLFLLVSVGSVIAGFCLAKLILHVTAEIDDAATVTVVQFVATFGVWLLAEHLALSGVVTIVVFGLTTARRTSLSEPARIRVISFATWETITFVLNVLAFTLIGLQLRPILETLERSRQIEWLLYSAVVVVVVVVVRLAWVLLHGLASRLGTAITGRRAGRETNAHSLKGALVVGWAGMRGIVTLAAALALPEGFPYRDFILLSAFTVVLGTLVVQGLTLRPLLRLLKLPADDPIANELAVARGTVLETAMRILDESQDPAAERLKHEYRAALAYTCDGDDPGNSPYNRLRRDVMPSARQALSALRATGRIGDEAYRQVEEELDWGELSAQSSDRRN